jgi:hypothetical protein
MVMMFRAGQPLCLTRLKTYRLPGSPAKSLTENDLTKINALQEPLSSCADLIHASTWLFLACVEWVDGRDKPGHDEYIVLHCFWAIYFESGSKVSIK